MRYPVFLWWSDEDKAWIAEVPDLPGCLADGPTQEEALREAEGVIEDWIAVATAAGRPVPAPSQPAAAAEKVQQAHRAPRAA